MFTVLIGIASFFIIPVNVDGARFLTEEEKKACHEELGQDWSDTLEQERFSWFEVWKALKAPHLWIWYIPLFMSG